MVQAVARSTKRRAVTRVTVVTIPSPPVLRHQILRHLPLLTAVLPKSQSTRRIRRGARTTRSIARRMIADAGGRGEEKRKSLILR
jgi:hypothetical protein